MNWKTLIIVLLVLLCLILAALVALAGAKNKGRRATLGGRESSFPYWAKALDSPQKMFAALKAGKPRAVKEGKDPVLIRTYPADYRASDALSNHYTESARIDCRFLSAPTPREAWKRHKAAMPEGLPRDEQREFVYGKTRECNLFNPAYAKWVIENTAGRGARVLDPSSGWGDRLIGALAAGAKEYHGYDPNPRLQKGYRRIVDDLGGGDHKAFRVTEAPFEDADLKPGSFDLAFTSPPYYAYETYVLPGGEGEEAQSIGRHQTYEEWVEKMYRPYLANAYAAVRPGGWLVFYIEDIAIDGRRYPLRELTREVMAELGAEPAGRFGLRVVAGGEKVGGRARRPRRTVPKKRGKAKPHTRWALAWRVPA